MRIFISYAAEWKAVAEPIAFSLRGRGHKVFLDRDDLPAGKTFDDQIQRAIERSDVVVFLISPEAVEKGRYTLSEIEFARAAWRHPGDRVLPVMIARTDLSLVPAFLKGVTILEPQGNITAEVAAAVERLRPHPSAGWHAASGVLVCAAAAAALGSLVSLTPASMGSGPVAATLWPWVASALVLGAPISLLLVILGGRWSWPALAPLAAMAFASQIAVPALLGDVLSLDVAELAPHAAAAPNMPARKEDTAAEESKKRLPERMKEVLAKGRQNFEEWKRRSMERFRGQNRIAEIVSRALTMMAWGAIMGLAALLGAALASAALRTPLSSLATVAAAAVAAPIASEIALGVAGLSTLLAAIGGFAVFYAGLGGALGYLMGRGGVAR